MRLTPDEVSAIKDSAREAFGESAVVRLFGSRVDDNLRGGDIDLLIEVDHVADDDADFMDQLGIVEDAARWSRMVKLRDELVHEHPLDAEVQFGRLSEGIALVPALRETHDRLTSFVTNRLPDHLP